MPRKAQENAVMPEQPVPGVTLTAADLIAEWNQIKEFLAAQAKAFSEHMAPYKGRADNIENQLLALLNKNKMDSCKTEHGTAYKSNLMNIKVENREAFLDYCNEHWDVFGSEALLLNAQKDAVKTYMDDHEGAPPPGLSTSWFTRVNIRKA